MANTYPAGIYNVDFGKAWNLILPPKYRQAIFSAFGVVLMSCINWLQEVFFGSYLLGAAPGAPYWDTASTFTQGQRIIYGIQAGGSYYGDNGVYEAITAVPTNTPPTGTNVIPQTDPDTVIDSVTANNYLATGNNGSPFYWVKVQDNFIGAAERASYSCQKAIFEYALNKWFNTVFRQPGSGVSDIYISPIALIGNQFYWGQFTKSSFFSRKTDLVAGKFFAKSNSVSPTYTFSINVPTAVYNALSAIAGQREGVVRAFADTLCPAGAFYKVLTY